MERAFRILNPFFTYLTKRESLHVKLIDWYLIREVIIPLFYSLCAFILLYIVYDLSIHFSDFFEYAPKISVLFKYYIASIPFIFVNAAPIAVLMASLYCLGQLGKNNEITALQASGVGFIRMGMPFMAIGLFMSFLVFCANENMVPQSIQMSQTLRQEEIKQKKSKQIKAWKEFSYKSPYSGRNWVGSYDPDKKILKNAVIREFRKDGSLKIKYSAEELRWVEDSWWLFNGTLALFDLESKQLGTEDYAKKQLRSEKNFYETPLDFKNSRKPTSLMPLSELREHIKIHNPNEAIYHSEKVDLHYKIAFPFISLVVIFLGVPLGLFNAGRRGSGALAGFGISLGLCLAYYAFTMFTLAMGKQGLFPAWLAAWLPNIVFSCVGIGIATKIFNR